MGIEGKKVVRQVVEKVETVEVSFPSITEAEAELLKAKERYVKWAHDSYVEKLQKLHSVYQGLALLHAAGFDKAVPDKYDTHVKTLEVDVKELPKIAHTLGSALIKGMSYPVDRTVKRGRQPARMMIWTEFTPKHYPGIIIKALGLSRPGQCSIQKNGGYVEPPTYSVSCK